MCVIIAKQKGIKSPSINTIKDALHRNPDGSAIAWVEDGKMNYFRTMNNNDMIKFYSDMKETLTCCSFVFHARIATNGSKNINNCHGWLTGDGCYRFFHNGILSITSRGDLTDSETFLRDIYDPIAECGHNAARNAINAIIGSSKFAFIRKTGEIKLYGGYTEKNGVYYSNTYGLKEFAPKNKRQSYEQWRWLWDNDENGFIDAWETQKFAFED